MWKHGGETVGWGGGEAQELDFRPVYTASLKTLKHRGRAHALRSACLPLRLGSLTQRLRDLGSVTALQVPAPLSGQWAEDHIDQSEDEVR